MLRIPYEELLQTVAGALRSLGFAEERALLCARLFAETTRGGAYTHGLSRFPRFARMIRAGRIDIHAQPELVRGHGCLERAGRPGGLARSAGYGTAPQRPYNEFVKTALAPALALLCSSIPVLAADTIPAAQAKDHLNETRTVCGKVADARYLETGSQATFLNFDKKYPQNPFLAFIATENRARFGTPEKQYLEKNICVTGKIQEYNGKPEIVLTDPKQIRLQSK